jgi:ribonuclease-3
VRRKSPTTIEELTDRLDLGPEHVPLLRLALIHRSQGEVAATNNERLEFLGDSVLGMLTNEYLYGKYPTSSEGELTRMKANVVNKTSLARAARPLGLGQLLDMARSEEALGGRDRSSTLADAFEAVLGAIYLNAGLDAARRFVQVYLFPEVDLTRSWDYKSTLQEQLQERFRSAPEYRITSETGPAHAKDFVAEVYLGSELLGAGRGGSKKQAEQVAAAEALMCLATRAKKTRRTRKPAPAGKPATLAEGQVASVEDAPEVPTAGLSDAASTLAHTEAADAPALPLKTFRRQRKKSDAAAAPAKEVILPSQDAAQPATTGAGEAETPSASPAEPARRVRRSRKVAAAEAVPDPGDAAPAPAAEAAPKRGRRVAKSTRAAEAAKAAPADEVAPPSSPVTPGEAGAPVRPRTRRRKPDVTQPGADATDEGN